MSNRSKERTVCYFVTSYVLVCALLACAMFAQKLHELDVFLLLVLFCTAPIIAFCGGLLAFGVGLVTGDIGFALLSLAAAVGTWGVWRGAKYAIYGKRWARLCT